MSGMCFKSNLGVGNREFTSEQGLRKLSHGLGAGRGFHQTSLPQFALLREGARKLHPKIRMKPQGNLNRQNNLEKKDKFVDFLLLVL